MKISLIQHETYGHCAIALEDISAGEILIEEVPMLVINYQVDSLASSVPSTLAYKRKRAFMTLSRSGKESLAIAGRPELHASLSNFYCPDQTSIKNTLAYKSALRGMLELQKRATFFPEIQAFTEEQLIGFSLLCSANAHAYDEHSIALLTLGTKITHTCLSPNLAVSTRPRKGEVADMREPTVKHIVLRDIRKGELLLGNYAKLTTSTTPERRKYLKNHKLFFCQCKHCREIDRTRGAVCQACEDPMLKQNHEVSPPSTMYRRGKNTETPWFCSNCKAKETEISVYKRWTVDGSLLETKLAQDLEEVAHSDQHPSESYSAILKLYNRSLDTFGWRHTRTAACAMALLDICAKVLELSSEPSAEQIDHVLGTLKSLPNLLETWFTHLGVDPMDELMSLYLLLGDQLMTQSSMRHDIIPRAMELTQQFLLKARPVIEQRRSWPIGHVLEEYYDELLQTLDQLVNGVTDDQSVVET